jgi:peptidyl-prolyl cis-trans isomerase SurA
MLPALAQDFSPRLIVNDRAISNWEYEQRLRMLTLFGAPGDLEAEAEKVLVDERLQLAAAESIGIDVTPEAISSGMEEFAARANLSSEEFIKALAQGGVSEETFRDFVRAGLLWREVVRARFGPRAQVTEAEIDRAIAGTTQQTSVRVLLAELVVPVADGNEGAARAEADRIRRTIRSEADFNEAARRFSAAPTAARGGTLDWIGLGSLPEAVVPVVLGLRPGQVSEPVKVNGAFAIFLLRQIEETRTDETAPLAIEYALFALPSNRDAAAEAARIRAAVDTCDDLYGIALRLPPEALVRETRPLSDVPNDLAVELARLDEGETALISRGGQPELLMLCGRVPQLDVAPSREAVRNQLVNRRLAGYANGYLEELRADAFIRVP